MGFSQALSGLNAASSQLDVIGNNIANSQTVGFKSSNALFADVYAGQKGLGTRVSAIMQNFNNGSLESTSRNLDLAIAGGGFFRMVQNDQVVYSRNGQLTMTSDGFLENAQGARLTGYPAGVGSGGQPAELQVPASAMPAKATSNVDAEFELDAGASALAAEQTEHPSNTFSYNYANSATIYDSQGNRHNVTLYFSKVASNEWSVRAQLNGTVLGPESISFDSNGALDTTTNPSAFDFVFDPNNGANVIDFELDLAGTTQFGDVEFNAGSLNQDGHSSGSLVGIAFDDAGNVIGNYSNEQSQVLGTIALANFRNPEGLKPVGDNAWTESSDSGQALVGTAGSGLLGSIESGTIETSNVDLTRELVDLIIAQRNFQANSQTIKVQDEVMQGVVNLR